MKECTKSETKDKTGEEIVREDISHQIGKEEE